MKISTLLAITALASVISTTAEAGCVCRCVNGVMQPLCTSSLDLPPICPPSICPITSPSIAPLATPLIPPLGTKICRPKQVLNPGTMQYEWKTVCR